MKAISIVGLIIVFCITHTLVPMSQEEQLVFYAMNAADAANADRFELALKALPTFEQQKKVFDYAFNFRFGIIQDNGRYKQFDERVAVLGVTVINKDNHPLSLFLTKENQKEIFKKIPSETTLVKWQAIFDETTQQENRPLYSSAALALLQNDHDEFIKAFERCNITDKKIRTSLQHLALLSGIGEKQQSDQEKLFIQLAEIVERSRASSVRISPRNKISSSTPDLQRKLSEEAAAAAQLMQSKSSPAVSSSGS